MATSTVHLTEETKDKLIAISTKRKENKNLAWSQRNIIVELVDKLHNKECK